MIMDNILQKGKKMLITRHLKPTKVIPKRISFQTLFRSLPFKDPDVLIMFHLAIV